MDRVHGCVGIGYWVCVEERGGRGALYPPHRAGRGAAETSLVTWRFRVWPRRLRGRYTRGCGLTLCQHTHRHRTAPIVTVHTTSNRSRSSVRQLKTAPRPKQTTPHSRHLPSHSQTHPVTPWLDMALAMTPTAPQTPAMAVPMAEGDPMEGVAAHTGEEEATGAVVMAEGAMVVAGEAVEEAAGTWTTCSWPGQTSAICQSLRRTSTW